jgi:signal peptidase I
MKSIYQFTAPKRWDVVVFRNPNDPTENYIKRLIATPGEKLELIGGDVYIDRVIQRKPEHVQDELWVQIYDSEYRPYIGNGGSLDEDSADGQFSWEVPFVNGENSNWQIDLTGSDGFKVDGKPGDIHTLVFDSSDGEKFRAFYAYNNSSRYRNPPWCSDFKIEFYADFPDETVVRVGAVLSKYGRSYRGTVDGSGLMQIERFERDRFEELSRLKLSAAMSGKVEMKFANVDHLLIFEVGDQKLVFDLGKNPEAAGVRFSVLDPDADPNAKDKKMIEVVPSISIVAVGKVGLSNISIFRDIHYINGIRALDGKPFEIGEDEFFVCGDNSPDSFDSRLWATEGEGHNGKTYRKGIVPRDYLVGKAFFLYWGDAFKPFENALPLIPNFSQTKRIYGGRAVNSSQ